MDQKSSQELHECLKKHGEQCSKHVDEKHEHDIIDSERSHTNGKDRHETDHGNETGRKTT